MITKDELEFRLATTLAPMLVTVAVFSLGAVSLVKDPGCTFTDEFLSIIAGLSIFAAAVIVDFALDNSNITERDRVTFPQGGYLCFCLALGFLTSTVFFLYAAKQADLAGQAYQWSQWFNIFFVFAGLSVIGKMMWFRDSQLLVAAMGVFYFASVLSLYWFSPWTGTCSNQGSRAAQHHKEMSPETGDIFFDETWP